MLKKILCVCKGNCDRSPMLMWLLIKAIRAAANLRYQMRLKPLGDSLSRIKVESAGVYSGDDEVLGNPVSDNAFTCMSEAGINLSALRSHKSQPISAVELNSFDLIICMTPEEAHSVIRLHPRGMILVADAINGGVENPFGKEIDDYRKCRGTLARVAHEVVQTYLLGAGWTNQLQAQEQK